MRDSLSRSVSVVIPAHNGLELTRQCVASILECAPHEILVVDNGSTDGTEQWLADEAARNPSVRTVRLDSNRGFAAACNAGIAECRTPLVLFVNNDTVASRNLIERLAETWHRSPRAGLVAPVSNFVKGKQYLVPPEEIEPSDVEAVAAWLRTEAQGKAQDVGSLSGLCLLAETQVVREVGAFDERFGLGNFEDDDLCLRIRLTGRRLLIDHEAYLYHIGNATFEQLGIDYATQFERQRLIFEGKWDSHPLVRIEHTIRSDLEPTEKLRKVERIDYLLEPETPAKVWASHRLATILEDLGRFEAALPHRQSFVQSFPLHTPAASRLAFSLLYSGNTDDGRREFARFLTECYVDDVCAASALTQFARWCYDRGDKTEALEFLNTALTLREDFLPAFNTRAVWLLEEQRFADAEQCLIPYRDRGDADLLANLGIALYRQGKIGDAIEAFSEGSKIAGPESAAARNLEIVMQATAAVH